MHGRNYQEHVATTDQLEAARIQQNTFNKSELIYALLCPYIQYYLNIPLTLVALWRGR